MKAALIVEPGRITVEQVPDPTPGPRDVVVQVAGCGSGAAQSTLAPAKKKSSQKRGAQ